MEQVVARSRRMRAAADDEAAAIYAARTLRPLDVPDPPRSPRPRVVIALVAAAAAIVVTAPFVIGRINDGDASPTTNWHPTTAPEPTPPTVTQTSDAGQSDSVIADRQHADVDVDGDGQPDDVRLMLDSRPDGLAVGLVEVTLATGATGSAPAPLGYPPRLLSAFDINRDGHEQVLLSHTAGGDEAQLLVYTWLDDTLVRARVDGHAPLALGLDGEGKYADYYTDDRGLISWLRGDRVDPNGPVFHVSEWSGAVDGSSLVATPIGQACVDATAQRPPSPCA
jgi:hypothetical protein